MVKKSFWGNISSCLLVILGFCLISFATQSSLFGKCDGHKYCSETYYGNSCIEDGRRGLCDSRGCHRKNNAENCNTCKCKKISKSACECK